MEQRILTKSEEQEDSPHHLGPLLQAQAAAALAQSQPCCHSHLYLPLTHQISAIQIIITSSSYYINICIISSTSASLHPHLHHFINICFTSSPLYLPLHCCMWPLLISSAVCTALGRAGYLVQCQLGGAGIISITTLGWNYSFTSLDPQLFLQQSCAVNTYTQI